MLEGTAQGGAASSIGLQPCELSAAPALAIRAPSAEISRAAAELKLTPPA
jgi:hypothetical protein